MGSRELRRLIEDNEAWLRRPGNHGQPRIVHRLRSSEGNHRRNATDHQQQSFTNAINERGRRQARAPPQHRGQEIVSERSRSPISRVPMESSRTTGERRSMENPSPGRTTGERYSDDSTQASDSAANEFIFRPPTPILPSRRVDRTSRESDTDSHQFEFRLPHQIPPSGRNRAAVNNLFNMLLQLHGMDVIRQAMSQMEPPIPPAAENPTFQERGHPSPNKNLQIDMLQTRNMSPQEDTGSCVICLTEFHLGEQITELRCNHKFHQTCILTWLQSTPTCPLCRINCMLTMS
ncbi:uncharacterized protein ACNLHF_012597 [Anomaloglossus baeobatrachus]|uniref:uncharacterized protein LOC142295341 n=1 Tax=Anomaloglossus baeobatrachus TaxID=238106 RepID=UPI003F502F78